ncbi:MAG: glycosyltransferase family 2 protein [Candidatus Magasanikbacteria bacterium]
MKDINIVFVNYLMKNDILKAIESIMADLRFCKYDVQIAVVDNSENRDGIKDELATRFSAVKYIDARGNVGFGKANNLGFNNCQARYYFALNPDTFIPADSRVIERIIKFMDDHPRIGCIGPKLITFEGEVQDSCYRFDLSSILIKPLRHILFDKKYKWVKKYSDKLVMNEFDHNETRPVDWVLGAAIVVRGDMADKIGWFDERYFMYLEDADWCRRMWDVGWPVYYVHDIVIKHAHARSSAQVPGIFKALVKNRLARAHLNSWFKFMWKWKGTNKYYRYKYK